MGRLEERLIPMQHAAELLKQRYPNYGNIFTKKTTGMTEFRIKRIPGLGRAYIESILP